MYLALLSLYQAVRSVIPYVCPRCNPHPRASSFPWMDRIRGRGDDYDPLMRPSLDEDTDVQPYRDDVEDAAAARTGSSSPPTQRGTVHIVPEKEQGKDAGSAAHNDESSSDIYRGPGSS